MSHGVMGEYLVIGAAGSIGGMLMRLLASDGSREVVGVDMKVVDDSSLIAGDILQPNASVIHALGQARVVLCALSNEVLSRAMDGLLAYTSPDCVLVDTLSIKSSFARVLASSRDRLRSREIVGINPMFSGDLDPVGRPVAVVRYPGVVAGDATQAFVDLLRGSGVHVVETEPEMHDRSMAALQTLVHAGIIAFGRVLGDEFQDIDTLLALAPPPFRVMLSLAARMTCNHPDVYWEIQRENPYAGEMRRLLIGTLNHLDAICEAGDAKAFREGMAQTAIRIVGPRPELVQLSRRIFGLLGQDRSPEREVSRVGE